MGNISGIKGSTGGRGMRSGATRRPGADAGRRCQKFLQDSSFASAGTWYPRDPILAAKDVGIVTSRMVANSDGISLSDYFLGIVMPGFISVGPDGDHAIPKLGSNPLWPLPLPTE